MSDNDSLERRLARASTIPSHWYFAPQVHEKELRLVFGRTWQMAGRLDQAGSPGMYFTTRIGEEAVVVVRGTDGKLRALSNVCRHRAGPVASGAGDRKVFQCGYHGWTYGLDGRLLNAPEFEGVEGFCLEDVHLPEFHAESWHGFVFVNPDPQCPPLHEWLEDLPERLALRGMGDMRLAFRREWHIACNWKVYVDNYLEGYHIPIVHPSLNRDIDYGNYVTETHTYYSLQHSPLHRGDLSGEVEYYWVFPNLMLNVYPDNYSSNLIIPLGPERTLAIFEWYFRDPENPAVKENIDRTVQISDQIQREDTAICEVVQRGLRSRTYTSGRYSVRRESGVHHFHTLLQALLQAEP